MNRGIDPAAILLGKKIGTGRIVTIGDEYEVTEPDNDGGLVIKKREEVEDNADN